MHKLNSGFIVYHSIFATSSRRTPAVHYARCTTTYPQRTGHPFSHIRARADPSRPLGHLERLQHQSEVLHSELFTPFYVTLWRKAPLLSSIGCSGIMTCWSPALSSAYCTRSCVASIYLIPVSVNCGNGAKSRTVRMI